MCGKASFLRKTSSPAVSFVSFLQEKKSYPFLFFLERKGSKRKSSVEKLFFAVPAASADTMHKTDGSHTNRPFLCSKQNVQETAFSQKNTLPRSVFCFFSSRKEIVPPSFLFRRKEAKENRLRESCFSVLLPFSITCNTKRTVHIRTVRFSVSSWMCGKASFLRKTSSPAVSFVSFLQEKKSYPLQEKKPSPFSRSRPQWRRASAPPCPRRARQGWPESVRPPYTSRRVP